MKFPFSDIFSRSGEYHLHRQIADNAQATSEPVLLSFRKRPPEHEEQLEFIFKNYNKSPGNNHPLKFQPSVLKLKEKDFTIPEFVWRAHRDPMSDRSTAMNVGLKRREPTHGDEYLAKIIMHSSSTSGTGGAALSLSSDFFVAKEFLSNRGDLYKIDTTSCRDKFKTIQSIILENGARLAENGLVTPATLCKAAEYACGNSENELFYIDGDIPPHLLSCP